MIELLFMYAMTMQYRRLAICVLRERIAVVSCATHTYTHTHTHTHTHTYMHTNEKNHNCTHLTQGSTVTSAPASLGILVSDKQVAVGSIDGQDNAVSVMIFVGISDVHTSSAYF